MSQRIDALTDGAALAGLAAEWRDLWRRVPDATPFQHPDWLLAWWECFGTAAPRVLTARAGGQLVGVLPLYRRDEPGCRKLLPIGISLSDYIDALVEPTFPETTDVLLTAIAVFCDWDECHLPGILPGSALEAAAMPSGTAESRIPDETCLYVTLPPALPRKKRQNLRRAQRAIEAAGAARFATVAVGEIAPAMDELFRLHEKRWRQRGEPGVCADAAARRFHRDAAARLAGSGLLRLHMLMLDGIILAVLYGFAANGIGYAYLCGFDPDWEKLGPGTLLLAHAIDAAAREGAREYHFLRGDETHKHSWGALARTTSARTLWRA